jgi:hypothetical protein
MKYFASLITSLLSLILVSCGGGSSSMSIPSAISISVSSAATSGSVAPAENVQFTATVTNTSNTAVSWQVNTVAGGNSTVGMISSTGLYVAPPVVPIPNTVTITAVSVVDSTKSASTKLTITTSATVSVTPASASVQINNSRQTSAQFSATVSNVTNLAVIWQVNGVAGGSSSDGTISSAGLYIPPPQVPAVNPVTITAVSVVDPTKTGSAALTILPALSISVTPVAPVVSFGGTNQFTPVLQNATNMAVTWQVQDFNNGGPTAVGTISSSGLYTAPANGTAVSTVTITATSVEDTSQVAQASVILTLGPGPNASQLNGHYAFSLKGLIDDKNAIHWHKELIGSLAADGAGNLTGIGDEIDFSEQPAPAAVHVTITGAYRVESDGRGSFALAITSPSRLRVSVFRMALGTIVSGVATEARFIEFDSALPASLSSLTQIATGTFEKQDPAAFSTAAISGDFAFGFSGTSAVRFAAVGRFHTDGAGNLTAGSLDTNESSSFVPLLLSSAAFTGTYSVDAAGRGTSPWMIPGSGTVTTVFYVVSSTELLFLAGAIPDNSWQPGLGNYDGVFSGPAVQQIGGTFSNSFLTGTSVFRLTGQASGSGSIPEFVAGEFTADGNGNFIEVRDENLGGSVTLQQPVTGTYAVAANGRATVTSTGIESLVLYLASPGKAFVLNAPPGDPQIGLLQPQTAGPFTTSSLSGKFTAGTLGSAEPFDPSTQGSAESGVITLDGSGNATGTVDLSSIVSLGSNVGFMAPDEPFVAAYSVSATGRGTMNVTSPQGGTYVLYLISPTNFFTMYVGPTAIQTGFQPGLVFLK